jgi:long-chain acyl-CoA synthetase
MTLAYLPWQQPPAHADRPAVRNEQFDLTYAEFASWVEAAAEQLAGYGVGPGRS